MLDHRSRSRRTEVRAQADARLKSPASAHELDSGAQPTRVGAAPVSFGPEATLPRPRPAVRALGRRVHGGPDLAELAAIGVDPAGLVDFSVNVSPLGPPPGVAEAIRRVPLDRYPDAEATALRAALAAELGLPPEALLVANGTAESIWCAAAAFLEPGNRALIVTPAFGEYEPAVRAAGGAVVTCPTYPLAGYESSRPAADAGRLANAVRSLAPRLVFLCNPNNPSGRYWRAAEVGQVAAAVAAASGLLVLDEAYLGFVAEPWDSRPLVGDGHVLLLRSLTKDLALAGLRLGYVAGHPAHIAALAACRPPWSVNAPAQAAGLAALADRDHRDRSRTLAAELMQRLIEGLRGLGYDPLPSETNFVLVPVGDTADGGSAARLRRALLRRGVLVRDCASFGLPGHIRLAARPAPEIDRLLAALADLQAAGDG